MKYDILINISTDFVHICDVDEEILLHRNQIEHELWPKLVEKYREKPFSDIFVINGPGGFTNLRAWVLCCNLLNKLENNKINFFNFSKPDIFRYAFEQKFLPQFVAINIWQKKNIRLYDLDKQTYETIKISDKTKSVESKNLCYDQVFDEVYRWTDTKDSMVSFSIEWKDIFLNFQWKKLSLDALKIEAVKKLKPVYFIKPILN